MIRRRPPWSGGATPRGTTPTGRVRRASGPFRPLPAAGQSAANRRRAERSRWEAAPALVLSVLLACWGATVHGTPTPLSEAVQRALTGKGHDPGEINGVIGWRTRGAIREFQRSIGLPDTGKIDDATLAALELDPPAETKPAADSGKTDAPRAALETPEAPAPSATLATAPGAGASGTGAPLGEPAPERNAGRRLSFAALGWHPPQTGADALDRFNAIGAPPGFKRGTETLVVPKGELIFVLKAEERIPGFDCDPGAEGLSIEFIFGPDGPAIFTPAADGGYCQAGIGIVLAVGRTLEMGRVDWGNVQYPRGTVRITNRGLEYVR